MPLPDFPAPVLFGPQRPLPSSTIRSNRTKRRTSIRFYLAERRASVPPWPSEIWPNKGPPFGQTGPNRGPPFGPFWPNDAEREGALGAKEGRCRRTRGIRREQVSKSGGRVLEKEEEIEGRGAVPERRKGTVPERGQTQRKGTMPKRRRACGGVAGEERRWGRHRKGGGDQSEGCGEKKVGG